MTITPDQAWQSALGQLQMEMPKASFDTWVRDTQLISCEDGTFVVGVRNTYAREWLESRLTSTVTRLLMGMMNQNVSVSFVVNSPVTSEADCKEDSDKENDEPETTEVQVVHRLRYDEIVTPGRVIALPGYFSRLIPEIGARNAWLYVGWRQAVWDGQRQNKNPRTRRIPVRRIIRYSGLSRRTFFRAIEESSTWEALRGLVERSDNEPHWERGGDHHPHRLPNRYTVHMTLRLSQADASAVQGRLTERVQAGESLLQALTEANQIQNLVGELLPPVGSLPVSSNFPISQTVMDIACKLGCIEEDISSDLQAAAESLHQRIISGFGTILLTHYFLETVIPQSQLTAPQAWLVALLRDRCYINIATGEMRDQVLVRGGYGELADWLGLSRSKTVWEWIRDEEGPVSAFVCVLPSGEQDEPEALRLSVRLDEPLFDGADGTHRMAQMPPAAGADGTINTGADGTHRMAEMAPLDGANGTSGWREWHRLKHLSTDQNTQEQSTTTTRDPESAAVPSSWVLRKLLIKNHVHQKVAKELLSKNAPARHFVAWLLFTCSKAGQGINNPLAYTLASLREDPASGPGGAYDKLANLPPGELIQLIRWSVDTASSKYSLQKKSCGNDRWEEAMGASERHNILLTILLGEDNDTPIAKKKVTQVIFDGEEIKTETVISHYRNR